MCLLLLGCDPGSPFAATDANDVEALRRYLESGGDPNLCHEDGSSLLYIATGPHGGIEVVRLLINHGADPDLGFGEYTPLMNAASWVSFDAVKMLVEAGANPTLKNSQGQTAFQCTGRAGGSELEVLEFLRNLTPGVQDK